jgi:hypothetical protein
MFSNRQGQMTAVGLIITLIVVVIVACLAPVIGTIIQGSVAAGGYDATDGTFAQLFPLFMIIAAIVGFFFWLAVIR